MSFTISFGLRLNNKTLFFILVGLFSILTISIASKILQEQKRINAVQFQTNSTLPPAPVGVRPINGSVPSSSNQLSSSEKNNQKDANLFYQKSNFSPQPLDEQTQRPYDNSQTIKQPHHTITQEHNNMVVIAVNDNPLYLFPAMISAFFWRKRHNFSTLLITVGPEDQWHSSPILRFASDTFDLISNLTNSPPRVHLDCPQSMSVSLSQTVRAFAGLLPQLSGDSWLMIADSDCWTINKHVLLRYGKSLLFTNAKSGEQLSEWNVMMYTAHHIGMYVSQWRSMMGLPVPKNEKELAAITTTYVQNFFGLSMHNVQHAKRSSLEQMEPTASMIDLQNVAHKALLDRPPTHMTLPPSKAEHTKWFMDQYLMAWKIDKFPDFRNDSYFENVGGKRIHATDSFDCSKLEGIRDAHIKYNKQNWLLIQKVFGCFVSTSDMNFINRAQKEFEKLSIKGNF